MTEKRYTLDDFDFSKVNQPRLGEPTILLRLVEGAGVALYRHDDDSGAELIPATPHLFPYRGGYTWGYGGSGPRNLSHAISAHLFQDSLLTDSDLIERASVILSLISQLPQDKEHDIKVADIEKLLA